ncbi:MAG TPA: peptidyl-alpha-hydroxyglycine alpha-amidating lyase family protein [Terriglobales bacterium]|nr:peptidyl-alpha-hydroxyglycine alpha-amidating lyase family protein [Terriglobales bacterium]
MRLIVLLLGTFSLTVAAQEASKAVPASGQQSASATNPTFKGSIAPNPYREIKDWAKLPDDRIWGHVFGVGTDSKGNVWVLDRCMETSCVNSMQVPPILQFDSNGNFIKSIGTGLFVFPHSLYVDHEDNIWVADCGVKNGIGNQVFKLSPDGKVLLTLGEKGVLGGRPENFVGPTDVVVAPNGDIIVADGHAAIALGGGEFYGNTSTSERSRMRVMRFSKEGKLLRVFGKEGRGPGEFDMPHGVALDSKGRIFIADRGNNRVQIFDPDGNFLEEWKQFGKACGLYIDKDDHLYVVDSDSNYDLWDWKYSVDDPPKCADCVKRIPRVPDVGLHNTEFSQGVRIGSVLDGIVRAFIPPDMGPEGPTTLTERITVDAQGRVFLADARTMNLRVFVKK